MENIIKILGEHPTAVIADAAFKIGATVRLLPSNLYSLKPDARLIGKVTTVKCNNDLVSILEGLMRAESGDVLLIDNNGFSGAGCIGDVIVSEAVRKKISGIVVYGSIRDSQQISTMEISVFCTGKCSVGPLKLPGQQSKNGLVNVVLEIEGTSIKPGDILIGDVDGVIVVETDRLDEIISKAEEIEHKEETLMKRIESGESLTDIFGVKKFLEKREGDPEYLFNSHLAEQNETI